MAHARKNDGLGLKKFPELIMSLNPEVNLAQLRWWEDSVENMAFDLYYARMVVENLRKHQLLLLQKIPQTIPHSRSGLEK